VATGALFEQNGYVFDTPISECSFGRALRRIEAYFNFMAGFDWRPASDRFNPTRQYYCRAIFELRQLSNRSDCSQSDLVEFLKKIIADDPRTTAEIFGLDAPAPVAPAVPKKPAGRHSAALGRARTIR
jgi:hypothetical protein